MPHRRPTACHWTGSSRISPHGPGTRQGTARSWRTSGRLHVGTKTSSITAPSRTPRCSACVPPQRCRFSCCDPVFFVQPGSLLMTVSYIHSSKWNLFFHKGSRLDYINVTNVSCIKSMTPSDEDFRPDQTRFLVWRMTPSSFGSTATLADGPQDAGGGNCAGPTVVHQVEACPCLDPRVHQEMDMNVVITMVYHYKLY